MDWSISGRPALAARLLAPLAGRWVADLEADTDEPITGAVEVLGGGAAWRGAVLRGGVTDGRWHGRVVGGAGGLDRVVPPASWQGLQAARGLVDELLGPLGETLDAGAGPELERTLPRWTRVEGVAHRALADLAAAVGARWRVTPGGTVWVGAETWPERVLAEGETAELLDEDPRLGSALYALSGAWLAPGVVLEGRRVGGVLYELRGDVDRAEVWWADG